MTNTIEDIDVWGSHGVAVPKITVQDMVDRGKLLTFEQAYARLEKTEPLSMVSFATNDGQVSFNLAPTWNQALDAKRGTDTVEASIRLGKVDYQLTKDSLLEATTLCGLTKHYVAKTPARLIQPQLDYWFGEGLGKDLQLMALDQRAEGFTKGSIRPFSNLRILEDAKRVIETKYGKGTEVFVDGKMSHSLRRTHVRLVVPEKSRTIDSLRNTEADPDNWSIGINFINSLIGEVPTSIEGYLFAWLCTNGAIDTHASSGAWNRRRGGQGDEVYEWAQTAVDEVLGGLEHTLDRVQAMTEVKLEGSAQEVSETLRDVFTTFGVPTPNRKDVIENMTNSDDLSMYGIMQSITAAANDLELPPDQVDALMRVGGRMPEEAKDRCESCKRIRH